MATRFADPPLAYTPPLKPNVTVAFVAGPALAAANDAIARMPDDIAAQSLDDIAGPATDAMVAAWEAGRTKLESAVAAREHYHSTVMTPANVLHSSLREHGRTSAQVFSYVQQCESEYGDLVYAVDVANAALGVLPAPTIEDLAYKLRWLVAEEFHIVSTYEAVPAALAFDADRILDGSMPGADVQLTGRQARLAVIAWQATHSKFAEADAAFNTYSRDVIEPLERRYSVERAKWPTSHDFTADPVAAAAMDAVDYKEEERQQDALWSARASALIDVWQSPAPNASALATKLKLYHENEGWELDRSDRTTEQFKADAESLAARAVRTFDLVGPLCETLERRNEAVLELDADTEMPEHEEARLYSLVAETESATLKQPATTPGDVVAKLIAIAQVCAEGHEPSETDCRAALLECQQHLGMGYVYEAPVMEATA